MLGAAAAVATHYLINFIGTLPAVQFLIRKFVWQGYKIEEEEAGNEEVNNDGNTNAGIEADEETVEWVNMCWRKAWRVYQRGLERWLADLLQPVFDNLVAEGMVPRFVQRLRIAEFTLDHEAPYFSHMRRRNSRKDSDLTGVVDVRYTGGARMLLLIECGTGRWRVKVPVMVADLDLECAMWLKIRLAPMCPYIGTCSLAFVGPPTIKVQLSPYNRVRLMRIPILQPFLSRLLTIDLPALMTLPRRLEITIPPAVTAVAEAAVGRDAVMRAVASAVLQADALEHALISALPLGPQGAAGGISLPDLFQGELQVVLKEARDLPVWGFPWQSNPYCRLLLGSQAVRSRRDSETSQASVHRAPVWNQEFQFLVEDPQVQVLEVLIGDSPITGRTEVGRAKLALTDIPVDSTMDVWLSVESSMPGEGSQGAVHLSITYRPFLDDDADSGYREAAAFAETMGSQDGEITDVKSAADASSRAAVAASAAAAAVAVTKAAAARAAARLARAARGVEIENEAAAAAAAVADADKKKRELEEKEEEKQGKGTSNKNGATGQPSLDLAVLARLPSASDPAAQEAAVAQLEAMAATMQQLTEEVHQLNSNSRGEGEDGRGNGVGGGRGGDAAAAEAAAKAVAAAEALAVTAVVAGDVGAANEALQQAAAALEKTAFNLQSSAIVSPSSSSSSLLDGAISTPIGDNGPRVSFNIVNGSSNGGSEENGSSHRNGSSRGRGTDSDDDNDNNGGDPTAVLEVVQQQQQILTPSQRAAAAIAAAQAAATAAAAAVEEASSRAAAVLSESDASMSSGEEEDIEASLAADAIPSSSGSEKQQQVQESDEDDDNATYPSSPWPQSAPWWSKAMQMVPGVPAAHDLAADAVADADGSATATATAATAAAGANRNNNNNNTSSSEVVVVEHQLQQQLAELQQQTQSTLPPVGDIILSPDIPIEEIAAEVQKSWKLRDRHVEVLLQKAVESRVRRSERPWLMLTAVMATASAVLLSIVLYRISTGG